MKNKIIYLALVLALVLVACSKPNAKKDDANTTSEKTVTENNKADNSANSKDSAAEETDAKQTDAGDKLSIENVKLKPEEAYDKFLSHVSNTKASNGELKVKSLKLEEDSNIYVYTLEGNSQKEEHEIKINADNGDIVKEEIDALDATTDMEITKDDLAKIDKFLETAKFNADAKSDAKDYQIVEYSIEVDDARKVINFELRSGAKETELKYDLETEKLIELDR